MGKVKGFLFHSMRIILYLDLIDRFRALGVSDLVGSVRIQLGLGLILIKFRSLGIWI